MEGEAQRARGREAATYSTKLLSALAVALVNVMFLTAVLRCGSEPRLVLLYVASVSFYAALYSRRRLFRRHRHRAALRRGLGYMAVFLGALLSALFFYGFVPADMPLPLGAGLALVIAVAAYFFYRVIVLHLEDAEEGAPLI